MTTTIDRSWLQTWIQPQHLEPDALQAYQERFAASPLHLLVVKDLLQPAVAQRLSQFLVHEAQYTPTFGSHQEFGRISEAEYEALPESDRFFRFGLLSRASLAGERSVNADTFLDLTLAIPETPMRAFFEAVSGYTLGKSEMSVRSMKQGDLLARHNDAIGERRLSFFFYLTPEWQASFGGELVMEREGGDHERITPEYNSASIFDVDAWHHIAPLSEALGDGARVTIGGWYHGTK